MKPSDKQGQRLWTRRGVLGLLGVLMSVHRFVWGGSEERKPRLSRHEADYHRPLEGARKSVGRAQLDGRDDRS
jgi:hypothetical protein